MIFVMLKIAIEGDEFQNIADTVGSELTKSDDDDIVQKNNKINADKLDDIVLIANIQQKVNKAKNLFE